MKIYDAFTFNDELDLLELRLKTLDPIVDTFVLVELPFNFRQQPKPMVFADNQVRFEPWASKIRYIRTPQTAIPVGPHPSIEHYQRRLLAKGLLDAQDGDLLMIGDVDEIPDPKVVLKLAAEGTDHPVTLLQKLYYYHVNRFVIDSWSGTVVMPKSAVRELDCEKIREHRFHFPKQKDGGWHFSWLGTEEQIANKVRCIDVQRDAAMHGSDDIVCPDPEDSGFLKLCRDTGADLFKREITHQIVPVTPGLGQPQGITEWLSQYPWYAASVDVLGYVDQEADVTP